ncbi:unnamed protein product [Rodentolepis nana]|uniref:CST complex subunit STN1 n=1 Tax=Rodentolepis nana TaxID=102285 RepID=A0A158QIS1_RODNA|nr:unnamed protein product [Rodentolepis nana]
MDKLDDDSYWIDGTVLEIPSERCPVILDPFTNMNFRILIGDIQCMSPSNIANGLFIFASRFVSYVDIVGVVRHIDRVVDDGTGQVVCTIWRKNLSPEVPENVSCNNQSAENRALAQKLIQLAVRATPVVSPMLDWKVAELSPCLGVGDTIHLRGRLQLFKESITISANYCCIIKNPQEELDSLLQAYHLKTHIYSQPYDPSQIFENLKSDMFKSSDGELLQRIQHIMESDGLFHFTALDLQLHAQVVEEIRVHSELVVDELCYEPDCNIVHPQNDTEITRSLESASLKSCVLEIIDKFLEVGIIYRSADPIGGKSSYYFTLKNRQLAKHVCQIISVEQKDSEEGVPFNIILEKLRLFSPISKSQRPFRSMTRSALSKLINHLLEKSRIYASFPDCYKIA